MLRIRNKCFGSCFGSGSGLKLVSDVDPVSDPDSNPDSNSGFESGPDSWIRIQIQIRNWPNLFFVLKFFTQPHLKAALHHLCDLAKNKLRRKFAIYEDLTHICILSVFSVPPPCRWTQSAYLNRYLEPQCLSPRRIGTPPPPSLPQWVCTPPPAEPKEGRTHSPAGEGVGKSQFGRLEKKPSTLSLLCRWISGCTLNTQLSATYISYRWNMYNRMKPPYFLPEYKAPFFWFISDLGSDPDPAKSFGSLRIRIRFRSRNTEKYNFFTRRQHET